MRPDAASFSPFLCPGTSINTPLADDRSDVHGIEDGQSVAADHRHATSGPAHQPDLTTSVKALLQQVAELHRRCDRLEAVKIELAEELSALQDNTPAEEAGATEDHTLTVYASSESTKADPDLPPELSEVNTQLHIISEVLHQFNARIDAQAARQEEFDKRFERKAHDQTVLKGRIGALEKSIRRFEEEHPTISDTSSSFCSGNAHSTTDLSRLSKEGIQQLQTQWADHEVKCANLHARVLETCNLLKTSNGHTNHVQSAAVASKDISLAEIQRSIAVIQNRAHNDQIVDEAATRHGLFAMFHQLSAVMARGTDGTWREGPFEVTSDEAFRLRDRVVCRLAVFNQYAAALKDAQDAKDMLDLW